MIVVLHSKKTHTKYAQLNLTLGKRLARWPHITVCIDPEKRRQFVFIGGPPSGTLSQQ